MVATNPVSQKLTLGEFLQQSETKPAREYFNGEVYQKPMPQGEDSILQTRLTRAIVCLVNYSRKLSLHLCNFSPSFNSIKYSSNINAIALKNRNRGKPN